MMIHQWHVTHILIGLRCVPALQLSQPTHHKVTVTQPFSNFFWLLKNLLKISSDSHLNITNNLCLVSARVNGPKKFLGPGMSKNKGGPKNLNDSNAKI